jgi:hypothetical protein
VDVAEFNIEVADTDRGGLGNAFFSPALDSETE